MNKIHEWINTTLTLVVLLLVLVGGNQSGSLGGGTRFPNGISADSTSPSAGQVRGTTLTTTGAVTIGGAATFDDKVTNSLTSTTTNKSPTSITVEQSDLTNFNSWNVGVSAEVTATLPATSTLTSFVPTAGDWATYYIRNMGGTNSLKIAAGAGMDLEGTATTTGGAKLAPGNTGKFVFIRATTTDITVLFTLFDDLD